MKKIISIALLIGRSGAARGLSEEEHNGLNRRSPGTQVPGSSSTAGRGRIDLDGAAWGRCGGARARCQGGERDRCHWRARSFISISTSPRSNPSSPTSSRLTRANLTGHPNLKLKLEGNTDERGTREYNIGLGERRAQAVRRALMLQGVAESQLTTVSFGAERPAVEGDDEAAWAQEPARGTGLRAVISARVVRLDAACIAALALAGCAAHAAGGGSGADQAERPRYAAGAHRAGGVEPEPARSWPIRSRRCAAMCAPCTTMSIELSQQSRSQPQAAARPVRRSRSAHEEPGGARRGRRAAPPRRPAAPRRCRQPRPATAPSRAGIATATTRPPIRRPLRLLKDGQYDRAIAAFQKFPRRLSEQSVGRQRAVLAGRGLLREQVLPGGAGGLPAGGREVSAIAQASRCAAQDRLLPV